MYRLLRLFSKVRARSRRCSSFPNRTRCRWAPVWLLGNATSPVSPLVPRRSKVRFAPAYFYACGFKISLPPAPLLLLCAKGHARLACSVASAPAAARCRCHLRGQGHFKIFRRCLFCYLLTRRRGLRIVRDGVFLMQSKRVSHSRRRSSFPRKAAGFAGTPNIGCVSLAAYIFAKAAGAHMPLLLLCAKGHARLACSVASALATVRCRCQPFAGSSSLQYFSQAYFFSTC